MITHRFLIQRRGESELHSCFPANYTAEFVVDPPEWPSDFTCAAKNARTARFQRIGVDVYAGSTWTVDIPVEGDIPRRALNRLISTPDPDTMVAVVGGIVYLVPVSKPADLDAVQLGGRIIEHLCAVDVPLLLFASDWSITAISESGVRWQSDRLAIEGIHLEDAHGSRVWAIADPDTASRDVVLDLLTGRIVDPSRITFPRSPQCGPHVQRD